MRCIASKSHSKASAGAVCSSPVFSTLFEAGADETASTLSACARPTAMLAHTSESGENCESLTENMGDKRNAYMRIQIVGMNACSLF
jgi:hypothetical protein